MTDFTNEHKQEMNQYFGEGVHKVKIDGAVAGETSEGKEFIEFAVTGEEGQEGNARVWFTTDKAIRYSFNVVRSIFVHNASKGKEQAARDLVDAVKNTDELVDLINRALKGKEAWYSVTKSDRTYTNSAGEVKNSYDRNLTGYEPKPKEAPAPVNDTFPGAQVVEGDTDVPFNL